MCISSYDKGDEKLYGVAYNLYSTKHQHYLEVRIEVEDGISIPSIVDLWRTANWHEREAYDMMGIKFEGHPNLIRIMNPDDFEGYPLRKDYPRLGHKERGDFPVIDRPIQKKKQPK